MEAQTEDDTGKEKKDGNASAFQSPEQPASSSDSPQESGSARSEKKEPETPTVVSSPKPEVGTLSGEGEIEQKDSSHQYSAIRDMIAPEAKIRTFNYFDMYGHQAKTTVSTKDLSVEQVEITRWQISNEILQIDRDAYLDRPGFKDAFTHLARKNRLLLLTGPEGCGLHTSIMALSHDLCQKYTADKTALRVFSFPHIMQSSPEFVLREFSILTGSILLFEDGIQTSQSFVARLLTERGGAGIEYLNDQLRHNNSWIIISGPNEPVNSVAREIYASFHRQKQVVELGMPEIPELFQKIITQINAKAATDITKFLSDHLPDAIGSLRTSQDVEFFARKFYDVFSEYSDVDQIVQRSTVLLRGVTNIQREVYQLFEEGLADSDDETLLAILLSAFDGSESNLFWGVYDVVKSSLISTEQPRTNAAETASDTSVNAKEKPQPVKARRVFGTSRVSQLRKIQAEEVEIREMVDGEEIAIRKVRFIDKRYETEVLQYVRANYANEIQKICSILEKQFILHNPSVNIRVLMARAIATLAQSNWKGAFEPIILGWAIHPDAHVRASVGYALEQVLRDNQYVGNLRKLLNDWSAAPISGQEGWYLKWTVASACKSLGLSDIALGLEYLRKLATYLGQRDLRKAKSTEELLTMIFDSTIESTVAYAAIQYTIVVFCIQGYIPQVMKELQAWIAEPSEKNPLGLIATSLFLGLFQEFGFLAMEAREAGENGNWEPRVLQEWNIQVFPHPKKIYVCNHMLQHLIENKDDKDLLDTVKLAMARTFATFKLVQKHGIVYAIFFQWIDELGQDASNIDLRETTFKLQKLFINMCRDLGSNYIAEIYSEIESACTNPDFPHSIQEFAKHICRDLNAPSLRYLNNS